VHLPVVGQAPGRPRPVQARARGAGGGSGQAAATRGQAAGPVSVDAALPGSGHQAGRCCGSRRPDPPRDRGRACWLREGA
jgi:hypothetical protein